MYKINYAAFTHPGRVRENNEDNFYVDKKWRQDVAEGCLAVDGTVRNEKLTLSVCDGMGGQELGEKASLIAVETLDKYIKQEKVLSVETLNAYIQEANKIICDLMQRESKRIGSTMTLLQFSGESVMAANIGDSRIYLLRKGELFQLSQDHTVVERMVRMGMISKEEAVNHPKRHQITQNLGIFPEEMLIEPTVNREICVEIGDKFLLCSDGLTDMLTDMQIKSILSEREEPVELARKLVQSAVDAGGKDNVTIVLAEVCKKKFLF